MYCRVGVINIKYVDLKETIAEHRVDFKQINEFIHKGREKY